MDEWPVRRRFLYLTTYQRSQKTDIHAPAKFEPSFPARERLQIYALRRAATGIDTLLKQYNILWYKGSYTGVRTEL
jgi:hypothetical protein